MRGLKFGVCYCDFSKCGAKVQGLVQFDTQEEAYEKYFDELKELGRITFPPETLWVVLINEETQRIEQFERYDRIANCKKLSIKKL